MSCRANFGRTQTASGSLHVSANLEPGSRARISVKPKVTGMGMIGKMMSKSMPDMSFDVPLCGEYIKVSPPAIPGMPSKDIVVPGIPCGFYALNLEAPEREFS